MNQTDTYKTLLLKACKTVLPPVLLLVTLYFPCSKLFLNQIGIEIELTANNADKLVFYWVNSSGNYAEELSSHIPYPAGFSRHHITLPRSYARGNLRIDPGMTENTVTISSLAFTNVGVKETLGTQELHDNIVGSKDTKITFSSSGLSINFPAGDPQIYLKKTPTPFPPAIYRIIFILLFTISSILLIYTAHKVSRKKKLENNTSIIISTIALTVFSNLFNWPFYISFLISIYLAYALLYLTITLAKSNANKFNLSQIKPLIITVSFVAMLFVPFILTIAPESKFISASSSAAFKAVTNESIDSHTSRIRNAINKIDESFSFRFANKDKLINLNAYTKIFGLGFSPTPKAIVGQDGMFFEGYGQRRVESDQIGSFDNITDYMGLIPFSEQELEQWLICLEERYYWLKEHGIDYIFVLAPTKALIYPENLPPSILRMKERINKPTRYQQLITYLNENSTVPVIDLKTPLLQAKETGDTANAHMLYYRTDFHWNYYGAFLAYQAIVEGVNKAYPDYSLEAANIDDFEIHEKNNWVHKGFISMLGLNPVEHQNETYLTFHPKNDTIHRKIGDFAEKGINDYTLPNYIRRSYNNQKTRLRFYENMNGTVPSIFVIGDSFSEKYFGFLSGHAKKTINFRTVYSFHPELFTTFSPTLVIQEVLNMYLLEKPPENSPAIKQARIRAFQNQTLAGS